jgi:hypothetical protein
MVENCSILQSINHFFVHLLCHQPREQDKVCACHRLFLVGNEQAPQPLCGALRVDGQVELRQGGRMTSAR